jgi:5-formyltetrahydrofolate cyclo-ligase
MTLNPVEIRARIQALRKSQDPAIAHAASVKACHSLLAAVPSDRWRGLTIALYHPTPDELDTGLMAKGLKEAGARLFYPRVTDQHTRRLEFAEITAGPGTWVKGLYGINEPSPEHAPVPIDYIDVIVMPGVAFGESGERLGMGVGFYDRALAGVHRPLRIALAFDFQLLPSLPQKEWDQKVDWILTERRDIRNPKVTDWLLRKTQP